MVRFLIPKHTLPTAPSVPTGPFKTHTSTSGISVSSNPFLARRRGDRLWHASSSYVPPRRRAKNALHCRLPNAGPSSPCFQNGLDTSSILDRSGRALRPARRGYYDLSKTVHQNGRSPVVRPVSAQIPSGLD